MKKMKNSDNMHMEKKYDEFMTEPMDQMQVQWGPHEPMDCAYVPPMVDTETMPIEANYGQTMDKERMGAARPWKPKGRK